MDEQPQHLKSFFVNRSSGILVRVSEVNDHYATIESLTGNPGVYRMPVAQYDATFVAGYRPAVESDLAPLTNMEFRYPANAPSDWA